METKRISKASLQKKIAFLNKYQGKVNRGAETFVKEVSRRLSKDFMVDVISKVNYLKLLITRYDIVVPTNGRLQVLITRLITWLKREKMVVSGQSGLGADDKWNLLCLPDVFVALTHYQEEWARKFNHFIKITVIPNGVDLHKFNSQVAPLKINLAKPIVLSVGALEKNKRLDLLIKSVAKTRSSLLIIGKGSIEKELTNLGNQIMPKRLKIMSLPHSDMPKVYTACDLFSYPTVPYESFGIAVVEAMASNLPVVAADDPIRRDIVGDAGFFVDPIDTNKYAQTLEKALHTKWGNKPRKQAENYSWDDIAKKYLKLFKDIC